MRRRSGWSPPCIELCSACVRYGSRCGTTKAILVPCRNGLCACPYAAAIGTTDGRQSTTGQVADERKSAHQGDAGDLADVRMSAQDCASPVRPWPS